jgi:site-specific DNA recombinase
MNDYCRIAIYLRLSKEDRDRKDESNSIINQRRMLRDYVRKNFEHYELREFTEM